MDLGRQGRDAFSETLLGQFSFGRPDEHTHIIIEHVFDAQEDYSAACGAPTTPSVTFVWARPLELSV
jgi:hypothetical protein